MIEERLLAELNPYQKNPRNNNQSVEFVLDSLKKHGQVKPIVVSAPGFPFENEVICAGHTTLKALEKSGAKKAKVIVHKFKDEAEFIHYNIADNKTGEFAFWDNEQLIELGEEFEIDLGLMGFIFPENEFIENKGEINIDDLDDTCELKIKFDSETFALVLDALNKLDDERDIALLKALNIEQ